MARLEKANIQELEEIASYHEDALKALTRYFKDWERLDSIRYIGMTRLEISEVFQRRLIETELRSILQVLTSLEAALRVDYLNRCNKKAKDPLSRAFRLTYQQTAKRTRLDDILQLWVEHHPELKHIIGQLRGALHLRHWLAHGRYWQPKVRYSYLDIEVIATAFFRDFPLVAE